MITRKTMSDKSNCKGCSKCEYYPYFHFTTSDFGDDIEFIKFDSNSAKVINHTTGVVHLFNGKNWHYQKKISFSEIQIGNHLSNHILDIMVISKTDKFLNGYQLDHFRKTGEIILSHIHVDKFENRLIIANLEVSKPTENLASDEQLNYWGGLKPVDISNIEIL